MYRQSIHMYIYNYFHIVLYSSLQPLWYHLSNVVFVWKTPKKRYLNQFLRSMLGAVAPHIDLLRGDSEKLKTCDSLGLFQCLGELKTDVTIRNWNSMELCWRFLSQSSIFSRWSRIAPIVSAQMFPFLWRLCRSISFSRIIHYSNPEMDRKLKS